MDSSTNRRRILIAAAVLAGIAVGPGVASEIPRTASGRPDLSGTFDTATLTPLQRDQQLGDKLTLTEDEAREIAETQRLVVEARNQASDPDRDAPPEGGDGSPGAAGNVGGYNTFWVDPGEGAIKIDGKYRTSIITDPPNGRRPPFTAEARARFAARRGSFGQNTGEAWWIDREQGPYDDPELRPNGERCLLGFGSTQGPPMLPTLYNNHKRIVQTDTHVLILVEMIHDARIIRIGGEHDPDGVRKWLGDSVGHWEGDTLVVRTKNFTDSPGHSSASRDLEVTERFRRVDADTMLYEFTVEDPATWTGSWTGEYPWHETREKVFEYACHEGNHSLGNILRGARLLEQEALAKRSAGESAD